MGYGCGPSDTGVLSRLPAGKKPHQPSPTAPWCWPSSLRMREDKCLLLKLPRLWSPRGCSGRTKTPATPGFSTAAAATRRRPPSRRSQTQVLFNFHSQSHPGVTYIRGSADLKGRLMSSCRCTRRGTTATVEPWNVPITHSLPLGHCPSPTAHLSVTARLPVVTATTLAAPGVAQKWNRALGRLRAQPLSLRDSSLLLRGAVVGHSQLGRVRPGNRPLLLRWFPWGWTGLLAHFRCHQ